ncbi:threonine synthase [Paenibacillus hamazuiensis]|uniref:threonine synthase n=1 Tax=Paenibacillus hamazuiensis TaxID=2936508 RepID=UPI00200F90E0|nr:threonine synthase [Paenibacillus hamazuiensis]
MTKLDLVCLQCHRREPFGLKAKCSCGGTMLVEYDLERIASALTKTELCARISSMWRYKEWLPVSDEKSIVTLGEGWTPLIRMPVLEKRHDVAALLVKREEQNPTGSFKSRGFSAAVSLLKEWGIRKAAVPSNGNAASALAAYAARAGIEATVIVPRDCPGIIVEECLRYGARTYYVDGLIHDAGRIIDEGKDEQTWFNIGTMREPGRVEGKKTMGLEIAEQLGWRLPDVIIYPTGGGSGIVGLWKAFRELKQMNWVSGDLPRLVSVQEAGCQPIVDAVRQGGRWPSKPAHASSSPTGLRVPNPPDGELIVSILLKTNGTAVAVSREEIQDAARQMGRQGLSCSPEGASTWAGFLRLRASGWIGSRETVVLFNTSHADKYLDWEPSVKPPVIRTYADMKRNF